MEASFWEAFFCGFCIKLNAFAWNLIPGIFIRKIVEVGFWNMFFFY